MYLPDNGQNVCLIHSGDTEIFGTAIDIGRVLRNYLSGAIVGIPFFRTPSIDVATL